VSALLPSSAGVYLAGFFDTVQGVSRPMLAQVDRATGAPTSWVPPVFRGGYAFGGTLIPPNLFALAERDDVLYVGGSFLSVGDQLRPNLVALDPAGAVLPWNPPGYYEANSNYGTTALDAEGPSVLAGSTTPVVNGLRVIDPASGSLAGWPPSLLGVYAVRNAGGYLLVGGEFLDAGASPSPNLAVFIDPAALAVPPGVGTTSPLALSRPSPNPARISTSVHWTLARPATVSLALLDLAGRRMRTIVDRADLPAGPYTRAVELAGLAPGLYVLDAAADGSHVSQKLVIAR
jgi:hypothetical protein